METTEKKVRTLEHIKSLAYNSYRNISQDPDRMAESTIRDYSAELDNDIEWLKNKGANDEQVDRYKKDYERLFVVWLSSQSNCASSFVCGPANFPVAKMEKRRRWADNHYAKFRELRTKVQKAYERYERKEKIEAAGGELEVARKKLESLEASKELQKSVNKRIKEALKNKENIDEYLLGLGVQPHMIEWTMKFGFGSCNTNANIRNAKKRILELENKQQKSTSENKEFPFADGKVIFNYEVDRLQIAFDQKPPSDEIQQLKRNGFRWSPFYKVWQRQLTSNAIYTTKQLLAIELQ